METRPDWSPGDSVLPQRVAPALPTDYSDPAPQRIAIAERTVPRSAYTIQKAVIAIGRRPNSTQGLYGRRRLITRTATAVSKPMTPVMIHKPITLLRSRS